MPPFSDLFSSKETSMAQALGAKSHNPRIAMIRQAKIRFLLMLKQRSYAEIDLIAFLPGLVVEAVAVIESDRECRCHKAYTQTDVRFEFLGPGADARCHGLHVLPRRAGVKEDDQFNDGLMMLPGQGISQLGVKNIVDFAAVGRTGLAACLVAAQRILAADIESVENRDIFGRVEWRDVAGPVKEGKYERVIVD